MVVRLSNGFVQLDCYPEHGFVITAIRPRGTDRNILWNARGASFDALPTRELGPAGPESIDSFDRQVLAGGWFPMFPTAGLPGDSGDHWMHGEAARLAWDIVSTSESELVCRLRTPVSGFELERSVRLESSTVIVSMTATNDSGSAQSITFGEHPCFSRKIFAGASLVATPREAHVTSHADPLNATLVENAQFMWPNAPLTSGATADLSNIPLVPDGRHDHITLHDIGCVEIRGDQLSVLLSWDQAAMPNALIWEHFQPIGSPWGGDVFAVEPSSAPGRTWTDATTVSARTEIANGHSLSTWTELLLRT